MLIYSLPLLRHFADRGGRGQSAEKVQAAKGSSPSETLRPPHPVSPLVLRRLEDEGRMRRDVARADTPVERAVGVEV